MHLLSDQTLLIRNDEGTIFVTLDQDGIIRFETLTEETYTKRITPRQGREHLYPVNILAMQTLSSNDADRLGKWLIDARMATR